MTTTLMQASTQWATRPDEQRFTSLPAMFQKMKFERDHSRATVVSSRSIRVMPTDDARGLVLEGKAGNPFAPTHYSFGQLASLVQAPAAYLRRLPSPLAADCLNLGLQVERGPEDIGVLLYANGTQELRAATGPNYGRIWNSDVVDALMRRFGDGVDGDWKVPGEFGQDVVVTKKNTTLFASDRDMFVFLADEKNRISIPNRRDGKSGTLARGFFMWNSEVGDKTFGIKTFLFDYACCNRIVWGAQDLGEIRIRHTASAPDKFLEQITPVLDDYANASSGKVVSVIERAQAAKVDKMAEFLATRFGTRMAPKIQAAHMADEGRPAETLWDVVTAVTAHARSIPFQAERIELETLAGNILELA
jgi:hypothetical protein